MISEFKKKNVENITYSKSNYVPSNNSKNSNTNRKWNKPYLCREIFLGMHFKPKNCPCGF